MAIDLEAEKKEILRRYRQLLRQAKKSQEVLDKKQIRLAFEVAVEAHSKMRRKSGEPYIYHPIEVARIVASEIGLGTVAIVCALLHDTVEDTDITLDDIERMFDKKVRSIIDGLTKISGVIDHSDPNYSIQGENFKKMMLTLSEDARVILVKLADRLHNMRTMASMPRHKQVKISYETLFIYAPLAHRLGLNAIKTELEDLAFRYTEPDLYADIQKKLRDSKSKLTKYINRFKEPIVEKLKVCDFSYQVKGRPKSIYSIARKMKAKNIPFEEVYDVFAIRIIIDSEGDREQGDCWSVYSLISSLYQPNPQRLRDWISIPKANGYEALHTTVMGPDGNWVEVQIRTQRMDEIAEKGLAAHWKYKGTDSADSKLENWIGKIRSTLENSKEDTIDFIDDLKMNLFSEEIFVFTPAGDLKSLPKGATVLDFAYEIHSTLGDKCIGAKVNQILVPLNHELVNGEQVEILHSIKQTPKEDWLEIVKTAKSKHAIKGSLKKFKKTTSKKGQELFGKITDVLKIKSTPKLVAELIDHYRCEDDAEFFYKVALKKIDRQSIQAYVTDRKKLLEVKKNQASNDEIAKKYDKETLVITDATVGKEFTLSPCCCPIPGDEVFGFITDTDGIVIHRTNCPNAMLLQANFAFRSIKAIWDENMVGDYLTTIAFTGTDDVGLISKIITIISAELGLNMKSVGFDSESGIFEGKIQVYVKSVQHVDEVIERLLAISDIRNIKRIHNI